MTNTTIDPYQTADHTVDVYEEFFDNEYDVEFEEAQIIETGGKRVIRLLLIILFFIALICVIIFGLMPYIDTLNQGIAPPLPPAIQT